MRGDVGRSGDAPGEDGDEEVGAEMWGDLGRCGEMWGDPATHPARTATKK